MIRVRILRSDPGGRFQAGEEGVLLVNDYTEKYDYFVRLKGEYRRDYYFYAGEIEVINA